jgi:hypothetical protein
VWRSITYTLDTTIIRIAKSKTIGRIGYVARMTMEKQKVKLTYPCKRPVDQGCEMLRT